MPSPGMGSQLLCCTASASCFLGGTGAWSRTAESGRVGVGVMDAVPRPAVGGLEGCG